MTEFLTAVLVVITAYYAWQTQRTVKVMEATNEANNRPVVSASVDNTRPQGLSFIDLVIRNSGNGLARDIHFIIKGDKLDLEEISGEKRTLKDISMIKTGIKTLAPHETRQTWLLSTVGRIDEILAKDVNVAITYKNADFSKTYHDEFTLDFASLNRLELGHDPLHHIDKEIEKIRKVLEKKK
jgi:hypothetical protein